eukprot:s2326_g2.t1
MQTDAKNEFRCNQPDHVVVFAPHDRVVPEWFQPPWSGSEALLGQQRLAGRVECKICPNWQLGPKNRHHSHGQRADWSRLGSLVSGQSALEILASCTTGAVVAFDVDSCVPSYAWKAHEDEITQICWVDSHRRLLTAAKDRRLRIWDFPAPGREFSPFHSPTLSTAPSISAPGLGLSETASSSPYRHGHSGAT